MKCLNKLWRKHMLKNFDENPTNASRAIQLWQILISKAHNRQIVTYGIIADLLGYKGAGVLGEPLGHIMYFCTQNKLPPLTAIVVNAETGLPGDGIIVNGDLNAVRENVFNYNWYGLYPPSETQFKETWQKAKENNWKI